MASRDLLLSTGTSYGSSIPSGAVMIEAGGMGESSVGRSGFVSVKVKDSSNSDGGRIDLKAGDSHGRMQKGGEVMISAGDGMNDADSGDGGDGGDLILNAAFAHGLSYVDKGGSVMIGGGGCKLWQACKLSHGSCYLKQN